VALALSRTDLKDERTIGITVLSAGGRTTIPKQVMGILKLSYSPHKREKLLWVQKGDEIVVSKGTLQSSFRKTILSKDGTAAIPKHIIEVLRLRTSLHKDQKVIWIQKGDEIIVRKGTSRSNQPNRVDVRVKEKTTPNLAQ
jgi:hypothetical protein